MVESENKKWSLLFKFMSCFFLQKFDYLSKFLKIEFNPNSYPKTNERHFDGTKKTKSDNAAETPKSQSPIDDAVTLQENKTHKLQIVWLNVVVLIIYHLLALHGLFYIVTGTLYWKATLLGGFLGWSFTTLGVTTGVHRLWAHRSYKAKLPLQILLCFAQTLAIQNSVYEWVRDHRVHHKFTDTDADPHNSQRGFFFSHMGWLMCRKNPAVILKGKIIDMSDLEADPVVMFQKKYYLILALIIGMIFPTMVPIYIWNLNWYVSFTTFGMFRYVTSLHVTWSVNSFAHMWGYKPYDKTINPVENKWVSYATMGEGWHNYHHVFPWDYRARELDGFSGSFTTALIEFFAKIGLAYDLKFASEEMIEKRITKTGNFDARKLSNQ